MTAKQLKTFGEKIIRQNESDRAERYLIRWFVRQIIREYKLKEDK